MKNFVIITTILNFLFLTSVGNNLVFANDSDVNIIFKKDNNNILYNGMDITNLNSELVFINGILSDTIKVLNINNSKFIPLRKFTDILGIVLEWDGRTSTITIIDNDTKLEFKNDNKYIHINDRKYIIEGKSILVDGVTYIDIDFIKNYFKCDVEYFNVKNEMSQNIIQHISITRYDGKPLSKLECTKILKNQLITAYENKFGEFIPLLGGEIREEGEKGDLRYYITNIDAISENNLYYVYNNVYGSFYVNKYTGIVYLFNANDEYVTISKFNANDENALYFEKTVDY